MNVARDCGWKPDDQKHECAASEPYGPERRMQRFGRIFIVVFTCLVAGIFALAIGQFVHAWQSGAPHDWSNFSESVRDVLGCSPLIALPASIQKAVQYGQLALRARDAAIAGNEYLAPVSDEQPEPLSGFELSSLSATLGPIRVPVSQRRVVLTLLLFCFLASVALPSQLWRCCCFPCLLVTLRELLSLLLYSACGLFSSSAPSFWGCALLIHSCGLTIGRLLG